jgi:pimeloyl-ACP methyl ester carboxylesterase
MPTYSTVKTESVTAHTGVAYAYRSLGDSESAPPLVLLHHFRGNLDNWDPALIEALAQHRRVITFDNVGVAATTGTTPHTIAKMATGALDFLDALELPLVDILGFSIGSFVAQELALARPDAVRRVVLASAAPQGAEGIHGWVQDIIEAVGLPQFTPEGYLHVFFTESEASRGAGMELFGRFGQRTEGADEPTTWATRQAHYDAVHAWGVPDHGALQRVTAIRQPVFVANGDSDRMIPPKYSYLLAGLLPDARVKIYPDAAHGFLYQHHTEFAADVNEFLS